jgi:hypothetical protein
MNVMHSDHSSRESARSRYIHDSLIQLPLERPRHATICAKSAARITVRIEGAKGA